GTTIDLSASHGIGAPPAPSWSSMRNVKASDRSRVSVESALDMKTTGADVPHRIPPNEQSAVYMIALTVRLAESRLGKSMISAAPPIRLSTCFLAPASLA